ncbi:glycosyltransferase family 4 protein [Virgibacillus kekensis]|uniref:Glycosyltransferase family 4 protein n=1 Tax=Virgibacillus kekensis TaxID=202261 RepID=A0ABV9DGM1_9BACI
MVEKLMKNICFIIKVTNNYGGAERRFARLINYISNDKRYKISVILVGESSNTKKFKAEYLINKNINIFEINNNIKVLALIPKLNVDIIHFITVNTSFIFLYTNLKLIKKNCELILSLNSYDLCLGEYKNILQKITFQKLLKIVNKIDCLYPSYIENVKKISQEISTSKDLKIFYPENSFTDLDKFQPSDNKNKVIVFASRLIAQKNPVLAIKSINECRTIIRANNYKVIFAGGGPLYSNLEEYIKNHNLEDIVKMTGNVDLSNILPKSRIFLSLQEMENYPSQSLLEAISSGNYIIASDVGDTKRIIDENFGMLTNLKLAELVDRLVEAIKFTNDSKKMSEISTRSREFAIKNFKISSYAEHIKEIWSQ